MSLVIVGLGPGGAAGMTEEARQSLQQADEIVGYKVYVDLVEPLFPGKKYTKNNMTQEQERTAYAIEQARHHQVALVCSGDPGIYGLAGLALELAGDTPVKIISGVSAAMSGAALLGAPINHDFAVISLSDLLTPWQEILERVEAAAKSGFQMVLYNPGSKKRVDHLAQAVAIIRRHRPDDTVCGLVRNIGREGESWRTLDLSELEQTPVDMFTTVFIGSERTKLIGGRMVTLRGYENKS